MTMPSDPQRPSDAEAPGAFALPAGPAEKEAHRKDLVDYFYPPLPVSADDDFWTSRPYKPNAREAHLITLALGLIGVLILGTTVWFPVFLSCAGAIGVTSILAGVIQTLGRYENPWWRLPPLVAILCGVIDLAGVASWLNTR